MRPNRPIVILAALLFALIVGILLNGASSPAPSITYAQTDDTPTSTPTPEDEQPDGDTTKPKVEEPDPEGKPPVEPVVDEPRTEGSESSDNAQTISSPATSHTTDYDTDDDGLIEISTLEQLNAVRWDLNGTGVSDSSSNAGHYNSAFPNALAGMGCPNSGCRGYELARSLDFDNPSSYASRSVNTSWTQGQGWLPIGHTISSSCIASPFNAIFDGNYRTISNLYINSNKCEVSLFGRSYGSVLRVGMIDVDLTVNNSAGFADLGGLVGWNVGLVAYSYSTGAVTGNQENIGGLVGFNNGLIAYSYSNVDVIGEEEAGGLVGDSHNEVVSSYASGSVRGTSEVGGLSGDNENGIITYSYSTGRVTGNSRVGGFTGDNTSSVVTTSYWDVQTSRQSIGVGAGPSTGIEGKTTTELQSPTGYYGIYANWFNAGDVWDFGTIPKAERGP